MSMDGKLSRAMAKSGAQRPDPATPAKDEPTAPASHGKASQAALRPRPVEEPVTYPAPFRKVPHCDGKWAQSVVMSYDPHGEVASQVRGLRGRILALNNGNPPAIIAISSGNRAEGKTTTAINLAIALSEIGSHPVLLIDGDMLCPSIHSAAGLDMGQGLVEALESDLDLNGKIYETDIKNLDILPSRPISNTSESENPLHQKTEALFAKLRLYYRYIVIDTPPVLAGSQACAFGKSADGVILVARLEKTSRHVVKRAADELVKGGANVIGCVLTHQEHHVPDWIYRFLGATPAHYYKGYWRKSDTADSDSEDDSQ